MKSRAILPLLTIGAFASCAGPSPTEIAEAISGPRQLIRAAGQPLPYVEARSGGTLEILGGTLTLTAVPGHGEGSCTFSLSYREREGATVFAEDSETVNCTYFRLMNTGIYFTLTSDARQVKRFESGTESCIRHCIPGTLIGGDVEIVDRYNVAFVFRK